MHIFNKWAELAINALIGKKTLSLAEWTVIIIIRG